MRSDAEAGRAVEQYADTVRRVCFMHLNNKSDVEDVFQEVFLKYVLHDEQFESDVHEKAWLIRIAINACRDVTRSFFRRKVTSLEDLPESLYEPNTIQDENTAVVDALLGLPPNYKNVLYLFYYEGYSAVEIAKILHKSENTIYSWLARGKTKMKNLLGGESFD